MWGHSVVGNDSEVIFGAISRNERLSGLIEIGLEKFDELFAAEFPDIPESALPPITRSDFQEERPKPSYFELFETLSLAVREISFDKPDSERKKKLRTFKATDIRSGILQFIQNEEDAGKASSPDAEKPSEKTTKGKRLAQVKPDPTRPNALKIVGCRITGDLDLSNLHFPGSIRFMGCLIEGALILDRTRLMTLDLSGSLIRNGISGMYLNTGGALRLRRTVSQGPIDMGGLIADGTVDFTDSILSPENKPSSRGSYVGDRGILNLAQSKLDKDLRLERARIYGGINIRGATIGGMFHLNDAILRSSLAHFEHLVIKTIQAVNARSDEHRASMKDPSGRIPDPDEDAPEWPLILINDIQKSALLSANAVHRMVRHLHPCVSINETTSQEDLDRRKFYHGSFADTHKRWTWEKLGDGLETELALNEEDSLQRRLMLGSNDATEAALRAEQVTVKGPLYARGLRVCGSIRMKRLQTYGTFGMNGARLRSANDVRISLIELNKRTDLPECSLSFLNTPPENDKHLVTTFVNVRKLYKNLEVYLEDDSRRERDRTDFVLNLEHATIRGDLDLSRDHRTNRVAKTIDPPLADALKDASLALLERYGPGRTLWATPEHEAWDADRRNAKRKFRKKVEPPSAQETARLKKATTCLTELQLPKHFQEKYYGASETDKLLYNPTLIIGDVKLDNITIEGSADFRNTVFNLSRSYSTTEKKSVRARNAKIELHLDLRKSVGMNGICLTSADIGGSIRCFDFEKQPPEHSDEPVICDRAICHPIFTAPNPLADQKAKTIFPDFDLDLATVGGSAMLLFHPEHGPNISASQARLGSKTYILPTDNQFRACTISPEDSVPGDNQGSGAENLPTINMTGLQTPFLSHNSGAWPIRGNLQIRNLKYESTDEFGHLFPRARNLSKKPQEVKKNRKVTRQVLGMLTAVILILFFLVVFLYNMDELGTRVNEVLQIPGRVNLAVFVIVLMIGSFSIYIEKKSHPVPHQSKPLALHWLARQKIHLNTRHIDNAVRPAEPYIRASAVLRAESRNISANRVDVERLRLKRKALWSRTSWPAKTLLKTIDRFIGYGFRPVRGMGLTILYIIFAAMTFNMIKMNGVIVPADTVELLEERKILGHHGDRSKSFSADLGQRVFTRAGGHAADTVFGGGNQKRNESSDAHIIVTPSNALATDPQAPGSESSDAPTGLGQCDWGSANIVSPHFHGLFYTLDSLVPFIDMGVENEWKIIDPNRLSFILDCDANTPLEHMTWKDCLYILAILIKLIGWGLITALAFSLLTRFETLLIRPNN